MHDNISFVCVNYPSAELLNIPSITLRRRVEVSVADTLGDVKITGEWNGDRTRKKERRGTTSRASRDKQC